MEPGQDLKAVSWFDYYSVFCSQRVKAAVSLPVINLVRETHVILSAYARGMRL